MNGMSLGIGGAFRRVLRPAAERLGSRMVLFALVFLSTFVAVAEQPKPSGYTISRIAGPKDVAIEVGRAGDVAEPAVAHTLFEILVRGADNPHVDRYLLAPADAFDQAS